MTTLKYANPSPQMALGARTAADLMTPNPMSIRHSATVSDAANFLAARGISAAPVIDEAGRPVGVVSSTDILIHKGQGAVYLVGSPEYHERARVAKDVAAAAVLCSAIAAAVVGIVVFGPRLVGNG